MGATASISAEDPSRLLGKEEVRALVGGGGLTDSSFDLYWTQACPDGDGNVTLQQVIAMKNEAEGIMDGGAEGKSDDAATPGKRVSVDQTLNMDKAKQFASKRAQQIGTGGGTTSFMTSGDRPLSFLQEALDEGTEVFPELAEDEAAQSHDPIDEDGHAVCKFSSGERRVWGGREVVACEGGGGGRERGGERERERERGGGGGRERGS
jgi:hypothetical protein